MGDKVRIIGVSLDEEDSSKELELINKEGWTNIEHYRLTNKSNCSDSTIILECLAPCLLIKMVKLLLNLSEMKDQIMSKILMTF
jgi:hypothetical protein